MTKQYLTITFLVSCHFFHAQGWSPAGARSMSLANSSVTLTDFWSFHHNPGATAQVEHTSAGMSYENRYLLKEIQSQAFVFAQPLKVGVISAGAQMYGYRLYKTTRIGLGYSMKLTEKFSAGVQLNYQGLRIENYGSKSTVTAEAGLLAKINSKVTLGFSILNIGRAKLAAFQNERFATLMRLGISYQVSKKAVVLLEADKAIQSRLSIKGGLEYEMLDHFFVRAGGASNPVEVTFGFGYLFKSKLKIDLGSAWQQHLGWSPHVGLSYEFKPSAK